VDAVNGTCEHHGRNRPAGLRHREIAIEIVARASVDLDGFTGHAVLPVWDSWKSDPPTPEGALGGTAEGEGGRAIEVGRLLLLLRGLVGRIVSRVDIIDREGAHAMDLNHGRGRGPAVMLHALVGGEETARADRFAFRGIELVAHRNVEGTDKNGDILRCW